MQKKLKLKKVEFSQYSEMLDLNIDDFTAKIKEEIEAKLNIRLAEKRQDKASCEKALLSVHGVQSHLITEYRRCKDRFKEAQVQLDKAETEAINNARAELSLKATEKAIRSKAYDDMGDIIYDMQSLVNRLEQRTKTIRDHIEAVKLAISGIQTVLNSMRDEWGSSKV